MSEPIEYGRPWWEVMKEVSEENARLKAEVESLKKPAIIGGYNLSEYIRMAHSETLEFDNGDIFAGMTLPERIKYIVESHARLKAEVERLTFDPFTYLDDQGEWMPRHIHLAAVERLQAEVERLDTLCKQMGKQHSDISCENIMLRKAGDAMADVIAYELRIDEGEELPICVQAWNAAKEGKQS